MTVMKHPQIAATVMEGPESLCGDVSLRQRKCDGANLAFIAVYVRIALATNQAGSAEGEEQVVLIEKIEGDEAFAMPLVDYSGREEAKRLDRDAECRGL
jgi:hypothetical protein